MRSSRFAALAVVLLPLGCNQVFGLSDPEFDPAIGVAPGGSAGNAGASASSQAGASTHAGTAGTAQNGGGGNSGGMSNAGHGGGGASAGKGGAGFGGSNVGGSNGGSNLGGSNVGGSNVGGSNVGGSTVGGSTTGGSTAGGADVGGSNVGGSNVGGSDGGSDTGGSNVGGADVGGSDTGGSGGAATGGSTSGGAGVGGSDLGGAGGSGPTCGPTGFVPPTANAQLTYSLDGFSGTPVPDDTLDVGGVAVDNDGNAIFVGSFRNKLSLPVPSGVALAFTPMGNDEDVLIAKLDHNGKAIWARTIGGTGTQHGTSVALTPAGDVLVAGWTTNGLVCVSCATQSYSQMGVQDGFVLKMAGGNGTPIWVRPIGAAGVTVEPTAVIANANDAVLAGSFNGNVKFGCGTANLDVIGTTDAFVTHFDANNGDCVNNTSYGETGGTQRLTGAAFAPSGDVIITGTNQGGTMTFPPGGVDQTVADVTNGLTGIFLADLIGPTTARFAYGFGDDDAMQNQKSGGVAVAPDGTIAITGQINGTVDFPPFGVTTVSPDAFVVAYDKLGTAKWVRPFGDDTHAQVGSTVAFEADGSLLVTGGFQGEIGFTTEELLDTGVINATDMFLAKLDSNGAGVWQDHYSTLGAASPIVLGASLTPSCGTFWAAGVTLAPLTFGSQTPIEPPSKGSVIFVERFTE